MTTHHNVTGQSTQQTTTTPDSKKAQPAISKTYCSPHTRQLKLQAHERA